MSDPPGPTSAGLSALVGAAQWSANIGYPGSTNPAVAEVVNRSLIPQMFGRVATGSASATAAVRSATDEVQSIYRRWRDQGRIPS